MKRIIATIALILGVAPIAHAGTQKFDAQIKPLVERYLEIQVALANDSTDGVKAAATAIAKQAPKLDPSTVSGEHAAHYKGLPAKIENAAKALAVADTIDAARAAFKDLSKPVAMWATMSKPKDLNVVFCSMAKGSWLQRDAAVRNPYYGSEMLACGEIIAGPASGNKSGDMGGHGEMKHGGGHGGH